MKSCSVIDAPSDLGLKPTGVRELPRALRQSGLLAGARNVRYAGHVPVPPYVAERDPHTGVLNPEAIGTFSVDLADRVGTMLDLGRFPLVLGGDCSILLGPALALRRRGRFGLFFIDGHGDYYSPESEPNGEVASMELRVVNGGAPMQLANLEGLRPLVREEDVIVYGIRDAEEAVANGSPDVRKTGMHVLDLLEVRRAGPEQAALKGLSALEAAGAAGFWIHLDVDVLNDEVMSAVDYRMPDGLWPNELTAALTTVLASPLAVGMDITIYNPTLDDPERSSARAVAKAITDAFAGAT